jgi:hypothetical protein
MINSNEGKFLYNLQTLTKSRQWLAVSGSYISLYIPVLLYSFLLGIAGLQKGYIAPVIILFIFQAMSLILAISVISKRLNNWLYPPRSFSPPLSFPKTFLLYVCYYFLLEKRTMLLVLKMLSLVLLYIILVWNKGKYDNSSFLLFYLVLLLAHGILPYLAVQFLESKLAVYRNLPLSLARRGLVFLFAYGILLVPEGVYICFMADKFPIEIRAAYYVNAVVTLLLLTSLQYSEGLNREEYIKACFGLFFISIFALHIQAFFVWILIQMVISIILFTSGYYNLSSPLSPEGETSVNESASDTICPFNKRQ